MRKREAIAEQEKIKIARQKIVPGNLVVISWTRLSIISKDQVAFVLCTDTDKGRGSLTNQVLCEGRILTISTRFLKRVSD
jgi:hypothetical protein